MTAGPDRATPNAPDLVPSLAAFARLLGDAGLPCGADRVALATRALHAVGLDSERDFRTTLRAVFVDRGEHRDRFEAAFDLFWLPADPRMSRGGRVRSLPLPPARLQAWGRFLGAPDESQDSEVGAPATATASAVEALRHKSFDAMNHVEMEAAQALLAAPRWGLARRRSRRLRAASSGSVDMRRSLRHGARGAGELAQLLRRRPSIAQRPLVLLCDVSGSMERSSRALLLFAHALGMRERLEAFCFATRLTRITPWLRQRNVDEALERVGREVVDFSGGTRIGEVLGAFNRQWSRRVLGHGAVVVIVSDGWDRGDPAVVGAELERLHRTAHRLVWLNPLLGAEGYQPLTRAMQSALPHVDDFLSARDIASLERFGELLAGLGAR